MKIKAGALAALLLASTLGFSTALNSGISTGELEVIHNDNFENVPTHSYYLKNANKRTELKFKHAPNSDLELLNGAKVKVRGNINGSVEELESAQDIEVLAAPAISAPTEKRIAVILFNFSNEPTRTLTYADHTIVTPSAAYATLFTGTNSVKAFFEEESRGLITFTGDVYGYFTVPDTSVSGDGTCLMTNWYTHAKDAAIAAGVPLENYTNIIFGWPLDTDCSFAGSAYVSGNYSFNNDSWTLRVLSHELSHNFGVMHASSRSCTNASGTRVSISSTCSDAEYGDPFTIMGSSTTAHNHGEMVAQIGWLDQSEFVDATSGGTFTISPLLVNGTPKLLRIARGDGTYFYIDYRIPVGTIFDKTTNGVIIRISQDDAFATSSRHNSYLVDTTPSTTTFQDAQLAVGQTLTDPVSGIMIKTILQNSLSATISISNQKLSPSPTIAPTLIPTVPPTPLPTEVLPRQVGSVAVSKSGNSNLSIPITFPINNTIIVAVEAGTFAGNVSCSDSRGNTYTVDIDVKGVGRLFVCTAKNAVLFNGDMITATYPAFSGLTVGAAVEVPRVTGVDQKRASIGNSINPSSGNITILNRNELLVSVIGNNSTPALSFSCGLTSLFKTIGGTGSASKTINIGYRYIQSSGTYAGCGALTASARWRASIIGYTR